MAPNPRVGNAFRAMKALGISEEVVKPVLRKLIQVYDKNWELIEAENYRLLADAIFDNEEDKLPGNVEDSPLHVEAGSPLRRSPLKRHKDQGTPGDDLKTYMRTKHVDGSPKIVILEEEAKRPQLCLEKRRAEPEPVLPKLQVGDKRKEPAASPQNSHGQEMVDIKPFQSQTYFMGIGKELIRSPQPYTRQDRAEHSEPCIQGSSTNPTNMSIQPHCLNREETVLSQYASKKKRIDSKSSSSGSHVNESEVKTGPVEFSHQYCHDNPMIKPKCELYADCVPQIEAPLAVIYPPHERTTRTNEDGHSSANNVTDGGEDGDRDDAAPWHEVGENGGHGDAVPRHEVGDDGGHVDADKGCENVRSLGLAKSSADALDNFEIASSPLGEVKISLNYNVANRSPDFHVPSIGEVLKLVEDKCLHSYKMVNPNFSLMNLMKEVCQCFLQLGTSSAKDKVEHLSSLKKSNLQNDIVVRSNLHNSASSSTESLGSDSLHDVFRPHIPSVLPLNNLGGHRIVPHVPNIPGEHLRGYQSSNSLSLVAVHQNKFILDDAQPLHNVDDISKGEEKAKISVINEVNNRSYPSKFYYIPQNIIYQSAYVNFSLARIGDEDCCMNCFNDCMASSIPCACTRETGGEFAYTPEGLVKQEFLDECISMKHNPLQHHFFYCKECPLERSKNEDLPDPCKGHLVKKFIKECWSKCGCSKYCGNRVVQRGINRKLQVFFTRQGKGWGLRTLEFLPRGTFVCEYVGEILTNMELYERNTRRTGNEEHTYPVLLDADWGSEGVLKDEEALCLDATLYGNVARYINHRCHDANLVEIPVEIETPDHHYYHLAFFTTRNVDALEELCWDYGIDFEDQNHPIKAFFCKCRSNNCRDRRVIPTKRSKQKKLVLG